MRSEKELWELVLSRQEWFNWGLCQWVSDLRNSRFINEKERLLLENKMKSFLPATPRMNGYVWVIGDMQPRIDWINERIKQIENETI